MRYRGQGHEITVSMPPGAFDAASRENLVKLLRGRLRRDLRADDPEGLDVEIMNWTLRLAAEQPEQPKAPPQPADKPATPRLEPRRLRPGRPGHEDRPGLSPRRSVDRQPRARPCRSIAEDETTTIVSQSFAARINPIGAILMEKVQPRASTIRFRPIRLQLMWDRLIAVVEEQALAADPHRLLDIDARSRRPVGRRVRPREAPMLAQAVTGTPGHINSMARAVRHFLAAVPGPHHEGRRHLPDQRPVEGHRPSARLHLRHADLPARQDGGDVRLDLPASSTSAAAA